MQDTISTSLVVANELPRSFVLPQVTYPCSLATDHLRRRREGTNPSSWLRLSLFVVGFEEELASKCFVERFFFNVLGSLLASNGNVAAKSRFAHVDNGLPYLLTIRVSYRRFRVVEIPRYRFPVRFSGTRTTRIGIKFPHLTLDMTGGYGNAGSDIHCLVPVTPSELGVGVSSISLRRPLLAYSLLPRNLFVPLIYHARLE